MANDGVGDARRSRYCCCSKSRSSQRDWTIPPDADFHADSLIRLSHGVTAYRLIEPKEVASNSDEPIPVIVCLHGLTSSSYIWADMSDLLADFEQGPRARVLVFDFYGRGRSPWTGVAITLDTLVTQTKELMEFLGLTEYPSAFIGFDLGGAVAAGFAAKYPNMCANISLISPLGLKFNPHISEDLLHFKYIGEISIFRQRETIPLQEQEEFFDRDASAPHRYLIDKQMDMVRWQMAHTPGYLGAILSTYRYFPVRGMEELFTAIGRHPRKALILWGERDKVCPHSKCIKLMEESFPNGNIVDILECGHNALAEKFEDAARELLSFNKDLWSFRNE